MPLTKPICDVCVRMPEPRRRVALYVARPPHQVLHLCLCEEHFLKLECTLGPGEGRRLLVRE